MNSSFQEEDDFSMWAYWQYGDRLVTRDVALALATRLVLNKFGPADLDEQLPFGVVETDTTWVIAGSKRLLLRPMPDRPPVFGKIELVISKKDCRILSYDVRGNSAIS